MVTGQGQGIKGDGLLTTPLSFPQSRFGVLEAKTHTHTELNQSSDKMEPNTRQGQGRAAHLSQKSLPIELLTELPDNIVCRRVVDST